MSEADSLSAEDLRNKLYHSLREKGLVDSLKTQLRNRLVSELQTVGLSQSFHKSQSVYAEEGSLIARAANSLVADHLRHGAYDYTLSVFLPESGTAEDKIFTTRDLLRLLNISSESALYKKLAKYNAESLDKKGFLWQLLCEVAKQHGYTKQDTGVQTERGNNALVTTLEEEFHKLDEYYASPEVAKGTKWAVEERMLTYQRQLEERARTEISLETARFKETELTRMRMDEREKYRKETEKTRKELERTYQAKVEALVERERNSIERLQRQQEIQEKETFAQRQSILEEIDIVRKREAELRRQMELNLREKTLWEDKVKSQEEMVKKREDMVRRNEVEFEKKLNDEINKIKTEQDAKYLGRNKDIEYREIRLKEDERRVHEELSDIKQVKDELREKRIKVNTLDADLQRGQHDVLSLRNQNELLSEKLRDMVDYTVLKDENTTLRRDLDNTKTRLKETQRDLQIERQKREEVLREMGDRLAKPTPDHMLVQTELDKARSSLRHEHALYQHQHQQTQIRLNEQVDRNRDLMRKYEEQSMQMKEMNREIRDLRHQLTHTRSALDNEVYGKPRAVYPRRSRSPSMCDLTEPLGYDGVLDRDLDPGLFSTTEPELLVTKDIDSEPVSPVKTEASRTEDYSYSSDLIEDTKKRLRSLEREAENLEQNYQNFHFRMTSVHASLPPTAGAVNATRENRSSYMGEHKTNGNTNHSARPAYDSQRATLSRSSDRPLSSTPNRQPHPMSYRPYTPPPQDGRDLPKMNMSVSPVNSDHDIGRSTAIRSNRPISMEDLEARPGSPSVVVVEGSVSHLPNSTPPDGQHHDRTSPQGQERSEPSEPWRRPTVALDNAWKTQDPKPSAARSDPDPVDAGLVTPPLSGPPPAADDRGPLTSTQKDSRTSSEADIVVNSEPIPYTNFVEIAPYPKYHEMIQRTQSLEAAPCLNSSKLVLSTKSLSLDELWRSSSESRIGSSNGTSDDRRRQEEEERRRQEEEDREYEEGRRRREEEKKKKEEEAWAREQEELSRLQSGKTAEPEKKVEKEEASGPAIDPVMQKYMDMVAAQKQKEKDITKKAISTWNKGRTLSEDKTPEVSEEISAADDKSEVGAAAIDDDFDW